LKGISTALKGAERSGYSGRMDENPERPKSRKSFSLRQLFAVVTVAAIIFALLYAKTDILSSNGRYRLSTTQGQSQNWVYRIDSRTGRVWLAREGSANWIEIAEP
jgi:hypothetical protein